MPVLSSFDPPANVSDFPTGSAEVQLLRQLWNDNVNRWSNASILGDPWSSQFDDNRTFYFNPLTTDIPASSISAHVKWTAFPGRINEFYQGVFSQDLLNFWADFGGVPGMPTSVCPPADLTPIANTPVGPRGWQDEYCEWSVRRNGNAVKSVMFTCENPEYWLTLWKVSPGRVLELYRELVSPAVQLTDLTLKNGNGNEVIDPSTNRPAYNPLNKWNFGTVSLPNRGGAVHLTSSPNTLSAEIYLAAAATILRSDSSGNPIDVADDLICCARYGRPKRNSDPLIGHSVNQIVRNPPFVKVTLANPVGLYIQEPDWSNWELPANAPAGSTPAQFWTVRRGNSAADADGFYTALHAVYEVPNELGFTVSDVKINGRPIRCGSQIAETFKIGIKAIAIPSGESSHPRFSCPRERDPLLPVAVYLQDQELYKANREVERAANERPIDIPTLCYDAPQNSTTFAVMVIANGAADITISVPEGGVQIQILEAAERPEGLVCAVQIIVHASAVVGDRTIMIMKSDGSNGPGAIGLLRVVPTPAVLPTPVVLHDRLANKRRRLVNRR